MGHTLGFIDRIKKNTCHLNSHTLGCHQQNHLVQHNKQYQTGSRSEQLSESVAFCFGKRAVESITQICQAAVKNKGKINQTLRGKQVKYLKVQRHELRYKTNKDRSRKSRRSPDNFPILSVQSKTKTNSVVITMLHCYSTSSVPNSAASLHFYFPLNRVLVF